MIPRHRKMIKVLTAVAVIELLVAIGYGIYILWP